MRQLLTNVLAKISKFGKGRPTSRPQSRSSRPCLEVLEDRLALSHWAGSLQATPPATAVNPGRTVAYSDVGRVAQVYQDSNGLHVNMYLAYDGRLLRQITVPGTNGTRDYQPTIAMSSNGGFVVAWAHLWSYSPYDVDVRAQPFDASGNAVGSTLWVGATGKIEDEPAVAMDSSGDFAVAYRYTYSTTDHDIYVHTYNPSGTLLQSIAVATSSRQEYNPVIAMNGAGQFAVAYDYADYGDTNLTGTQHLYVTSYGSVQSGGQWQGGTLAANGVTGEVPSIAMDRQGNFAVAFTYRDSKGISQIGVDRFNSAAQFAAWPITVTPSGYNQRAPSIAMAADGRFVVEYVRDFGYYNGIEDTDILMEEFSATGTSLGTTWVTTEFNDHELPTVAMDSAGDIVENHFQVSGSNAGQYGNLYTF